MASHRIETYCHRLTFPIGALIFSRGINRLFNAGRLDPIQYFRRHARGDWGDVTAQQWGRPTALRFNQARRWNRTT